MISIWISGKAVFITIADLEKAEKEIKEKNMDLKVAHEKLSSLNKDLKQKVKERTAEVEKLLLQKDEFIGQLGHDLKNPLNSLVNLLPVLEEREHNPESKNIFEVVNRNVEYMRNLVVKTIELARLNSPNTELTMDETNLLDEVNNAVEKNKLELEDNNMELNSNIDGNIIVKVDRLRIEELFDNLIDNPGC
jgi:signal transduction histidine kinase